MKKISLILFALLSTLLVSAQTPVVIDLSSGREADTLMPEVDAPDLDWTYTDPNGATYTPVTRYTATAAGWAAASCSGIAGVTRWITGGSFTTGYHFYKSKEFVIPAGASNAVLNMRCLSFTRNWNYLVKKNVDQTETETLLTATTYMSDGAKGWLNSRSPELVNYALPPGTYYIRVTSYTNSSAQRQAIDFNGRVSYVPSQCAVAVPLAGTVIQPTCATAYGSFNISNYSSAYTYTVSPGTGVVQSGSTFTAPAGTYTITANDGSCTSASSAGVVINVPPSGPGSPLTGGVTQPTCATAAGSFVITNYNSAYTYTVSPATGVTQSGSNITAPAGTYTVTATDGTCTSSPSAAVVINTQPATPAIPQTGAVTHASCGVSFGGFSITNFSISNTYAISPAAGVVQSGGSITAPPGTYTITATAGSCVSASSGIVTIDPSQGTTAGVIDLRTGIDNTTGQIIPVGQIDPDWTVYDVNGNLIGNTFARVVTKPGNAYSAQNANFEHLNNQWIELVNNPSTGSTIFTSRKFTVPTSGTLSFRVLSSVANKVFLDEIYADGTQRERFLVKTTNAPPNNTGNPYYSDFIAAGTYQLRVLVGSGGGKMDVFARVNYGACANPVVPTFAAVPDILPGNPAPVLPTTSLNGISGTWSPATVSATTSGLYTFFPTSGCCATSTTMYVPVKDWTKAPNSYIFDPADAQHDGIYIPVKKAYAMWTDANADFGLNSPITGGTVSAVVYWEDVSGLIKTPVANSYNLTIMGSGEDAKIKVPIDKTKGKGNAVIAFKVNDEVKWSWHVWVTDDITANGSVYRQGYETGKNDIPFSGIKNRDNTDFVFQWMNRNLGATNTSFLGNGWNKSSGMMYQWGRKDPIPPLTYKDATGYSITGDAANATTKKAFDAQDREYNQPRPFTDPFNSANAAFGWVLRPFNDTAIGNHSEVPKNIKYSVQHPLTLITYDEWKSDHSSKNKYATWFSDQEYKVNNTSTDARYPNSVSWDLWSDNRKGLPSNVTTQDTAEAREVRSYEYKSAYDPCPCNWRIPSHYGTRTVNNNTGPWGRANSGGNDDSMNAWSTANGFHFNPAINGGKAFSKFALNVTNDMMPNVKAHVGLGFDFTGQQNRNLGILPITGAYVFLGPNLVKDYRNDFVKLDYINYTSVGALPTASYGPWNGVRVLGLNAEAKANANDNIFMTLINETIQTNGAGPVRCMTDPNSAYIGNFETEYIDAAATDNNATLKTWTKDPNSYIVMTNTTTELRIKLRKAFAMQRLYLSPDKQVPVGTRSAQVYWTTNTSLISNVSISGSSEDSSEMVINLQSGQTGNAVVALRIGNTGTTADSVIWSWHIWAPETDPRIATYTYTTESTVPATGTNIVKPTKNSATPPLTTTFMDRNLGALIAFPDTGAVDLVAAQKSMGLQYQWGRKDPLPSFMDQNTIFIGTGASLLSVNTTDYNKDVINGGYTTKLSVYGDAAHVNILNNTVDKQYEKTRRMMNYAVQNPLTYLYNDVNEIDWISASAGLESERWGHAAEKSPYDPCPEGWRIPDMLYTSTDFTNGSVDDGIKGSSPWYYGDVPDPLKTGRYGIKQIITESNPTVNNGATGLYMGVLVNNAGWRFKSPGYKIGNFPIMGVRGVYSVGVTTSTPRVAVWSAAQTDGMHGKAFGLSIRDSHMETGADMLPHQAMSCRCAKIRYDANGKEIGRYEPDAIPVPLNTYSNPMTVIPAQDIKSMVSTNNIIVFPNPVSNVLRIQANEDKPYHYQIYNMTGQMVMQGQFKQGQTDVSSLSPGAYLVRINNAESVVKIVKQ